jgi:hypothetical protein
MSYDQPMAARYDRGRELRAVDVERWMDAARPYLPGADGRILGKAGACCVELTAGRNAR